MLRMVPLPRFAGEDKPSHRTLGRSYAQHDGGEEGGVEDEAGCHGRKEAGDPEAEPVHGGKAGAGADGGGAPRWRSSLRSRGRSPG